MHEINQASTDKFNLANRYITSTYIGSGSTGVVYKANNINLDTVVALKVLKIELTKNKKFMKLLNEELTSVFSLNHPNIVNVKEMAHDDSKYFIVMEYVDGKNLETIIKENTFLKPDTVVNYLEQLASAIDYAHQNSVIHKAIKPKSILISDKGSQLKLTGFGLSKALATTWLTITGASVSNVEYIAPEQAEGEELDSRCDIYSLGIVAYQMLTGEVPFKRDGGSILSLAMKHINLYPAPPRAINPDIPGWLETIVMKCLEKKPENRFQSGKEIIEALKTKAGTLVETKSFPPELIKKETEINISDTLNDFEPELPLIQKDELQITNSDSEDIIIPGGNTGNYFNKGEDSGNKNQFQLKILLTIVIILELIIIAIFLYIFFK